MFDFILRPIRRNFGRNKSYYRLIDDIFGFIPNNIELYKLALVHKSASIEVGGRSINNERLEFLGDAVIESITSDYLFIEYPEYDEGKLTKLRSKLVSRQSLNAIACKLGLDKLLTKRCAYELVQLIRIGDFTFDAVYKLTAAMSVVKRENLSCLSVIYSLELLTASDRPVHRVSSYAELLLELVEKVEGIASLTVHLVDEGEDRNIAHRADLEELSRLRLDTLCRVDDHYRRVCRHKSTVGVLREVLVTRGIKNIYAIAVVLELKHRGGDGYTSLLLYLHPVGYRVLVGLLALYRACGLYCASVKQKLLGKSSFTCVGVRDYCKRSSSLSLFS